jgi:hypothetical protein
MGLMERDLLRVVLEDVVELGADAVRKTPTHTGRVSEGFDLCRMRGIHAHDFFNCDGYPGDDILPSRIDSPTAPAHTRLIYVWSIPAFTFRIIPAHVFVHPISHMLLE